jgi:hypothetical protein
MITQLDCILRSQLRSRTCIFLPTVEADTVYCCVSIIECFSGPPGLAACEYSGRSKCFNTLGQTAFETAYCKPKSKFMISLFQ